MSEELDYSLPEEEPEVPPAAAEADLGPNHRPPRGILWPNKVMDLPRGAFENPPPGTTYRSYFLPASTQPRDSRHFNSASRFSKTFFARLRDVTGRTWLGYHILFQTPTGPEWCRFWFQAPTNLKTT